MKSLKTMSLSAIQFSVPFGGVDPIVMDIPTELRGERGRRRFADATAGARDDGDFVVQSKIHLARLHSGLDMTTKLLVFGDFI